MIRSTSTSLKIETILTRVTFLIKAIVMRRRVDDGEAIEGFYTIRSLYSTHDQISHMVAFEDRGDATNFCYLLQSFFEDLEDFQVDVVPVTIQVSLAFLLTFFLCGWPILRMGVKPSWEFIKY